MRTEGLHKFKSVLSMQGLDEKLSDRPHSFV